MKDNEEVGCSAIFFGLIIIVFMIWVESKANHDCDSRGGVYLKGVCFDPKAVR